MAISGIIICAAEADIVAMWRVGPSFVQSRQKLLEMTARRADPPKAEVLASVAYGLLQQGLRDDAIVLAAVAIQLGEGADINSVGASALHVVFDPAIAESELVARLQHHVASLG